MTIECWRGEKALKNSIENQTMITDIANGIFKTESQEIANLSGLLTDDFEHAVEDILKSEGKLIVSGMGKSGLIGTKIAATLASTGTPSFFLHPGEAYHGDLGVIEKEDTVLLLSNSGETDEILKLIPFLKTQGNRIIAVTGNPSSTLAMHADYHLNVHVQAEGCPLNLAPMASTTAMLVMGDALAAALMQLRGFEDRDFAQYHPGGSLGRRLLTKVEDVMSCRDLPVCSPGENIKEITKVITQGRYGLIVVVSEGCIEGVITDGDIRRAMEDEAHFFSFSASMLMTHDPKTICHDASLTEAQSMMTEAKINSLIVTKKDTFVGIIQIYDIGL